MFKVVDTKHYCIEYIVFLCLRHFVIFIYTKVLSHLFFWALGCAVLIAETMLDGQTPYSALQSLNMLAQTEGIERTESQYADLLSKHGFCDVRVVHTTNFLDAFIAIKM